MEQKVSDFLNDLTQEETKLLLSDIEIKIDEEAIKRVIQTYHEKYGNAPVAHNQSKIRPLKRSSLLIAACITLLFCLGAAAYIGSSLYQRYFLTYRNADLTPEEIYLLDHGVKPLGIVSEGGGFIMELVSMVGDDSGMLFLLTVEREDAEPMAGEYTLEASLFMDSPDVQHPYLSFMPVDQIPSEDGKAAFILELSLPAQGSGQPYTLSDLQELPLFIHVQNLIAYTDTYESGGRLAHEEWEFPFIFDYQSVSLLSEVNRTIQTESSILVLENIQISPLSVIIKGDVVRFGPEGKRHPEVAVVFSDGARLDQFYSDGMSTLTDGYMMEFEAYYLLNRPLDIKKIEKIIVDGIEFPVSMFELTVNE